MNNIKTFFITLVLLFVYLCLKWNPVNAKIDVYEKLPLGIVYECPTHLRVNENTSEKIDWRS